MNDYSNGALKNSALKEATANAIVAMTSVFVENKKVISEDKQMLKEKVKASSEQIRKIAQETLHEVKDLVGLMNIR